MKKYSFIHSILIALVILAILTLKACGSGSSNDSSNDSGVSTPEASATIGPSGGTLEVTDPSSPLYGVKVDVPAGAFNEDTTINIKQVDTEPSIPETAGKVSKTVSLEPGGIIFDIPVSITIPYDDTNVSDENTLQVFQYNGYSWEGVTFKNRDTGSDTITALSLHFSEYAVLYPKNPQGSGVLDTGFKPDVNGFSIRNFGYPGNCAGMVNYAKWFYENNSCDLFNSYDDDTAEDIAESATSETNTNLDTFDGYVLDFIGKSDKEVANSLIDNLETTKTPEVLVILETDKATGDFITAHAVLVYAYDYDNRLFYFYDPNFPGEESFIMFDGENLEDYYLQSNPPYADIDYAEFTSNIYDLFAMETVFNLFPSGSGLEIYTAGNNNSYSVYGSGNGPSSIDEASDISQEPENYGYEYLGSATSTSEFEGCFVYYLIKPTNIGPVQIDAFKLSGTSQYWFGRTSSGLGVYSSNYFDSPCDEWPIEVYPPENVFGPPDGNYSCLSAFVFMPSVGWVN